MNKKGINKAVFIDRDGTININFGYISKPDDFIIYPNIAKSINLLNKNNFKILIVTNQSGIARKIFSIKTLKKIHNKMIKELNFKKAKIDAIYYCPHHPNKKCNCRKPKTGLFKKAMIDFNINIKESFIIGDKITDIEAGYKIGCKTILIKENEKQIKKELQDSNIKPDFICNNFYTIAEWIVNTNKSII